VGNCQVLKTKKNVEWSLFVNNDFVNCYEVNVYTTGVLICMQCKMFIIKWVLFQIRWVEHVACMEKRRGAYRILVGTLR
jgi:hypothetical protein